MNTPVVQEADAPMDSRVDRRSFLHRAGALAAAATVGTVALPAVAYAGPQAAPPALTSPNVPVRPEALKDVTELTIAEAASLIRSGRLQSREAARGLPRPDRRVTTRRTRRSTSSSPTKRWPGRDASAGTRGGAAARHPAGHQGQLLHRAACPPRRTRTSSRTSCRRSTPPPWPASRRPAAIVLGKTQMGPLATTRATTPGRRDHHGQRVDPGRPERRPGRFVVRHGHLGRRPDGDLGHRHPDRRLDHRAVERAEPDRPQADDGPGVAATASSR